MIWAATARNWGILRCLILPAVLVPATPAQATCAACTCTVTTTPLNFGSYDPTSPTATTASSNVTVSCFSLLVLMFGSVDVGVSSGTSGVATSRKLTNGASSLNYNLYQDSALTTIWGNGTNGGLLESLSINGLLSVTTTRTAYGSIPARQWVKAGTYTDSIVVTVSY